MSDEALLGIFGIGLVLGPAIGGLVGWRFGAEAGGGLGALLIGLCGTATALGFGWRGWQLLQTGVPFDPHDPPWGAMVAFSIFGLVPIAMGLFLIANAVAEARPARRRAESPQVGSMRARIGRNLTIAANLLVLTGVLSGLFIDDDHGARGFGRTFAVIGIAVAVHGVAFIVRREGDWRAPAICFVIALGFGLFGALARLVG